MPADCDVAIIGAGPYGLSLAAHLRHHNVRVRIFGKPMHSWANTMPEGMLLKSEGFASNLSDPDSKFTLAKFCQARGIDYADIGLPIALETFVAYGQEFQKAILPDLKAEDVTQLEANGPGFRLHIADGEVLTAKHVVVAVGTSNFAAVPPELSALSSAVLSHSSQCRSVERFRGQTVAVLGAGASALDLAAALVGVDATVHVIARRSKISFGERATPDRTIFDRLRAPMSGLGQGWRSRFCTDAPLVFYAFPKQFRARVVKRHLGPASGWFVKQRVQDRVEMHLAQEVIDAVETGAGVSLRLADRQGNMRTLRADHLIAASGYRVDVSRMPWLSESILARLDTIEQSPALSRQFESSVPGLYFIGLAAAYNFGPLMRFAFGARYAARRLSAHLVKKTRSSVRPRGVRSADPGVHTGSMIETKV